MTYTLILTIFLEMTCDLMTTDLLYYVNFETYHTKKL